jgi:hypothetical protein
METKFCPSCQTDVPISDFYVNRARSDGLGGFCCECQKKAARTSARQKRLEFLQAMGGQCVRCEKADPRFLQIDHIDGGGNKKEEGKNRNTAAFYKKVLANSDRYQLLCANCNCIKRIEDAEHVGDRIYDRMLHTTEDLTFCSRCKLDLPLSEFYVNRARTSGRSVWCILCMRVDVAQRNRKYRRQLLDGLGGVCIDCGEEDERCFQVDHVEGGGKIERQTLFAIGRRFMEKVLSEPDRYELVCANCNWIRRDERAQSTGKPLCRQIPEERKEGPGRWNPEANARRGQTVSQRYLDATPQQKTARAKRISDARKGTVLVDGHWVKSQT